MASVFTRRSSNDAPPRTLPRRGAATKAAITTACPRPGSADRAPCSPARLRCLPHPAVELTRPRWRASSKSVCCAYRQPRMAEGSAGTPQRHHAVEPHRQRRPSCIVVPSSLIRHAIGAAPCALPPTGRRHGAGCVKRRSRPPDRERRRSGGGQFEPIEAAVRADVSRPSRHISIGLWSGKRRVRRRVADRRSMARPASRQGQTLHNSGLAPLSVKENRENNNFCLAVRERWSSPRPSPYLARRCSSGWACRSRSPRRQSTNRRRLDEAPADTAVRLAGGQGAGRGERPSRRIDRRPGPGRRFRGHGHRQTARS